MKSMRMYGIVLSAVMFAALTGCDRAAEDRAAEVASSSVREANQTLQAAGEAAREGAREARVLAGEAGQVAREGTKEAARLIEQGGLTAKVKTALLADESVPGAAIDVDTNGNVVTLSGRLNNRAEVERALTIARSIEGVGRVENRLTVERPS